MRLLDLCFVVPLVAVAPACSTMKSGAAADAPAKTDAPANAEPKDEGDGEEKESAADKVKKKERELDDARVELKIARQECQAAERKHKDAVEEAEYDLNKAKEALDLFQKVAKDLEIKKVALGLDRALFSVEKEKAELEELMSMYKKEEFAKLTKELVLTRGQRELEFSNRALAMEQVEAKAALEVEIPRKEKELELALHKSENALREARAEQTKLADENELKLRKAERSIDDLEKELAKLRAKKDAEDKAKKAAKP